MTLEIKSISSGKFSWIFIISLILTVGFCVGLGIIWESGLFLLLVFLLIPVIMILSVKAASRKKRIIINTENFVVDERTVDFNALEGYHLNKQGMIMSSLDMKLTSGEIITITCSNFGEQGKKFTQLTENLVRAAEGRNSAFKPMEYQDVHVKQMKVLRPVIIAGIIIVVIADLLALLMLVTGQGSFPWQILLINVVFLSLIPYLKKPRDPDFPKSVNK